MKKYLGRSSVAQGFTIIEVLIVLAIAGLILLIVFLAVPALQRNSRNTQYKNEAERIFGAAHEFINSNNLTVPTVASNSTTSGSQADAILKLSNTKNITRLDIVVSTNTAAISPTTTNAFLQSAAKCGSVGGTSVTPTTGASVGARNVILVYAVENSDGTVNAQCLQ